MRQLLLILLILVTSCNQVEDTKKTTEPLYDYDVEERLEELNIKLSPAPPPVANYVNAVRTGNLMFMAGKGPNTGNG